MTATGLIRKLKIYIYKKNYSAHPCILDKLYTFDSNFGMQCEIILSFLIYIMYYIAVLANMGKVTLCYLLTRASFYLYLVLGECWF